MGEKRKGVRRVITSLAQAITGILVVCLFVACSSKRTSGTFISCKVINVDGSSSPELKVELASTPSQRSLGLMYRKTMDSGEGMLFVFPDEQIRSFWMKNTFIPLDIIYFDANKRLVSVIHNATPHSTESRKSEKPAKFVLEVNAGLAQQWRLISGSRLEITQGEELLKNVR